MDNEFNEWRKDKIVISVILILGSPSFPAEISCYATKKVY